MQLELPAPIAAYLAADNSRDRKALLDCFTPDALVRDEDQDYQGADGIDAWRNDVEAKYRYKVEPLDVTSEGNSVSLHVRLTGDFPGSPVEPDFIFTLAGDKIASLVIA